VLIDIEKIKTNIIDFKTTIKTLYALPKSENFSCRLRLFDLSKPSLSPIVITVNSNSYQSINLGLKYDNGFRIIIDELSNGKVFFDVETDDVNVNKLRAFIPDEIFFMKRKAKVITSTTPSLEESIPILDIVNVDIISGGISGFVDTLDLSAIFPIERRFSPGQVLTIPRSLPIKHQTYFDVLYIKSLSIYFEVLKI